MTVILFRSVRSADTITVHCPLSTVNYKLLRNDDIADIDGFSVCPQALQVVKGAGLVGEDVDDHGTEVQQLPGVAPMAFPAQQLFAQILQGVLRVIAEGLDVGCLRATG